MSQVEEPGGRADRRPARPEIRPRRRRDGHAGGGWIGRDELVRPAAPPRLGAGRPQPPLPVVGPGRAPGRVALPQHHLHRLRGRPAHGQGGLQHQLLRPRLGLDRTAAGLRRRRARSSARPATSSAIAGSTSSASSGPWSARSSRRPRPTSGCCCSRAPSTGCRAPPPGRRRWRSSWSCSRGRTGSRRSGGGRWWAPAGRCSASRWARPVIQFFGWRTLFWGQLVLLVIASVVVALLLPSDRRTRRGTRRRVRRPGRDGLRPAGARSRVWEGMDWVGSWSLAGSVTAAMLVLSIGPIAGWTSPAVITCGRRRGRAGRSCSSGGR